MSETGACVLQEQTLKRYVTQKRLQVNVNTSREVLEAEISKHFATAVRSPSAIRSLCLAIVAVILTQTQLNEHRLSAHLRRSAHRAPCGAISAA